MIEFDRFAIFIIDDQDAFRNTLQKKFTLELSITSQLSDKRIESLGLVRELAVVDIFETQKEANKALYKLKKEGTRYTFFLFDADLSLDYDIGTITGGLALWKILMNEVIEERCEKEFFSLVYTRSEQLQDLLSPLFNFNKTQPLFLHFGKTIEDVEKETYSKIYLTQYLYSIASMYLSKGLFKAGSDFPLSSGQTTFNERELSGGLSVNEMLRDDLKRLILSPIDDSFWKKFGEVFSGRRYYLEINEGDGFFWTRQFCLASLFPYETKAIVNQLLFKPHNETTIRTKLSRVYDSIFQNFQTAFYAFCQFFDIPFNQFLAIPHIVYNQTKLNAYGDMSVYLTSLFSDEESKKLSHLVAPDRIGSLSEEQVKQIRHFIEENHKEMLKPNLYNMDSLVCQIEELKTGEDFRCLTKYVREQLIDFAREPSKILTSIYIDDAGNVLTPQQIEGSWNFVDFPLYAQHVIQLIKIFVLNFEKHNSSEYKNSNLSKLKIRFERYNRNLALTMSAPGEINDWDLIKKNFEDSSTSYCQPEKLSGFRRIVCNYYDGTVEIHSGKNKVFATKMKDVIDKGESDLNDGESVFYRAIFPKFSERNA